MALQPKLKMPQLAPSSGAFSDRELHPAMARYFFNTFDGTQMSHHDDVGEESRVAI
jgi:hypothetical protein